MRRKGRIRVHLFQKYMNYTQADTLQYYLENLDGVKKAQVFNRTSDALIYYTGERNELLKRQFRHLVTARVSVPAQVLENSGRELNETYKEKLVNKLFSIMEESFFCHIHGLQFIPLQCL